MSFLSLGWMGDGGGEKGGFANGLQNKLVGAENRSWYRGRIEEEVRGLRRRCLLDEGDYGQRAVGGMAAACRWMDVYSTRGMAGAFMRRSGWGVHF